MQLNNNLRDGEKPNRRIKNLKLNFLKFNLVYDDGEKLFQIYFIKSIG